MGESSTTCSHSHIPIQSGWIACTTLTGLPCTIARCCDCDRNVWSASFGPRETWVAPGWGEDFRHVMRWYHFRLRRIAASPRSCAGR